MAISYDDWKKQYEAMTTDQQKNYASMVKWNTTATEYANRYIQEKQNAGTFWTQTVKSSTPTSTQTNTSTSTNNYQNNTNTNGTNWSYDTPTNTSNNRGNNNWWSSLSDWKNGDWNTYWKFTFDVNEFLDESKFWTWTGVKVQEWTAKDTGRPDYQIESDARLNEMVNNLNTYWQTNPEFFSSREEFNKQFEYNQRQSDAQRALLDSYWKKAQDFKKANSYSNPASFWTDLDNWDISESEFEALKQYNPEVYIKWQKEMQDKLNAAIANLANPFSIDDMTTALNKIVEKFNLQAWDPYQIIQGWEDMMQRTWAWDSMNEAKKHFTAADNAIAQIKRIQSNYSSSTGWNQSDALVAARLQKATLPYESLLANELSAWQHWHQLYQTQLWTANNYANTIQMQAREDERIFQQKIKALWFAMDAYSYRTPEQRAQLQLQTQSIQNDMSLLQQSKLNDLSLYNKYATWMMEAQLEYDLTDLDTTNEKQLKTNLKNVLDQYYEAYWDIIMRPEQQVIDDVLEYAKANWVSVSEALKKNFIEPLQWKSEYKQAIADKYWMNPTQSIQKIWDKTALVTKYANWMMDYQILDDVYNTSYDIKTINWKQYLVVDDWNWVPQLKYIWDGWSVLNYASLNQWLQSFMSKYEDWTFYKDKGCWYFCNEYLTSIWDAWHVWSTWESKKALCSNKDWNNLVPWSIVAIDSWATFKDSNGNDVNAWHVSIVAWYDPATWKVLLYDANKDWDWKVRYWETTVDKLYWYYTPESYKNAGTDLPDYLANTNEYWFIDSMTWNYGQYIMWKLNNVSINRLGWDKVLQDQINNWFTYLETKWKNNQWYIEWMEDLYETYLSDRKLPAAWYLWQLWWANEFIAQATAYWKAAWYWRYSKKNENWYYDDLVPLYNEYVKSGKVPTEAQVEDYGWLDDFYKTAKAYSNTVWFQYTPEERDQEIKDMQNKWMTSQDYKDMQSSIESLNNIQAMLRSWNSWYWDYTAVYLLNKLRDPDSVVREQEFANTRNVWWIPDRIYNYFQQLQNWKILNSDQKVQIYNEMNTLMKAKIETYNKKLQSFRQTALKWWDISKIWTTYSINIKWNVNFWNLTWSTVDIPHMEELN